MTYLATVDDHENDDFVEGKDKNGCFNWLHRFSSLRKLNLIIEGAGWDVVKPFMLKSDTIKVLSIVRDDRDVVLLNIPKLRELCIGDSLYRLREDMEKVDNIWFIDASNEASFQFCDAMDTSDEEFIPENRGRPPNNDNIHIHPSELAELNQ
ncbi:unnamed protein product [Ambrosiozyma monospora]|uniref:Unnamed protein product n=1 Tax=Ambrosiozyma monospora TaxID=43982 RepID=A0ACB5TQM4_AMBMO|nr:unnamed protein product [Ambrosiozyma monospora]